MKQTADIPVEQIDKERREEKSDHWASLGLLLTKGGGGQRRMGWTNVQGQETITLWRKGRKPIIFAALETNDTRRKKVTPLIADRWQMIDSFTIEMKRKNLVNNERTSVWTYVVDRSSRMYRIAVSDEWAAAYRTRENKINILANLLTKKANHHHSVAVQCQIPTTSISNCRSIARSLAAHIWWSLLSTMFSLSSSWNAPHKDCFSRELRRRGQMFRDLAREIFTNQISPGHLPIFKRYGHIYLFVIALFRTITWERKYLLSSLILHGCDIHTDYL